MARPLHYGSMLLGTIWAQSLLLAGLTLLFSAPLTIQRLMPALAFLSAGLFVAMWLVIDKLVRQASTAVVGLLKVAVGLVFWVAGGLTVYTLLTGQTPLPPLSL